MKPNPSVILLIRDVAHEDWDDLPELVDVSDLSDDESESSERESELDDNTPRENKGKRHRSVKRGRDGRAVWPRCADELFSQAITLHVQSMLSWRVASTRRGDQTSTDVTSWPLRHRNFSPATLPRRNQFLADQFFDRGSRRAREQVARDLERRRMWYQGKTHGNK